MESAHSSSIAEPVDPDGLAPLEYPPRKVPLFGGPWVRTGLLLVLTAAYLLPLTQILYPSGDDGTLMYGAQRVSEGAIPGRDFMEIMGPGSFYWLGLFFKLFGAGWEVSRLHLLFTGVATASLLYAIARQVCSESAALLLWLFVLVMGMPLWPVVSHHWDSNLFAILAVWCYLRMEKTGLSAWAAAAGALAGITSCFIQQKGLLILLGFIGSAALRRLWSGSRSSAWKPLWLLLAGYAAVGAGVLGTFWKAGALRDLLYANVVWPLTGYHDVNVVPYANGLMTRVVIPSIQVFNGKWAILGLVCSYLSFFPFLVIAILPLLAVGPALASLLFKDKRKRWSPWLAVALAGAGLWLSEMHRKDSAHLAYGSPLLLIALLARTPVISYTPLRKTAMVALITGLMVFGTLNLVAHLRGVHTLKTRRGTVMSVMDDRALRFLTTSVKERELVFVYPYCPVYYYLADLRNPTRFSLLLYGYNTPAQFDEVIRDLEEKHVRYVLDAGVSEKDVRNVFPAYHQPASDQLKLERYLQERYVVTSVEGGFRILQRRANEAGSTAGGVPVEYGYETR